MQIELSSIVNIGLLLIGIHRIFFLLITLKLNYLL